MDPDSFLDEALDAWQVGFQTGQDLSASELCGDRSELIPELAARILQLKKFAALIVSEADPLVENTVSYSEAGEDLNTKSFEPRPDSSLRPPQGFFLERELGRGGMGVVYLAWQSGLNRQVAIKMMATESTTQSVFRFLAEAEAVAAVRHPNVVSVHQFGQSEGRPYLVLEYCGGGDLAKWFRSGPRSAREVATLLADVAEGVNAAHLAGIVHRDLKPQNVVLTAEGSPKVSDFGMAKQGLGTDLTPTGAVLGTPAYMSPEQAGGSSKFVGPESDVWALGVILYELLTGRRPFPGPTNIDYVTQILAAEPSPPRVVRPDIPQDLELIVLKCLRPNPRERYATAGELAADLQNWLNGRPISARPTRKREMVVRWVRKHPSTSVLIALFFVLAFTIPPFLVWNQSRIDRAQRSSAEARSAQRAAETLAEQRQLFSRLSSVQQRSAQRLPGWTLTNLADIRDAARQTRDTEVVASLRDQAATAGSSYDLEPLPSWDVPFATGTGMAVSPDGSRLAIGEYGTWALLNYRILILDSTSGEVIRRLGFQANTTRKSNGDLAKDAARSLLFSPDGNHLYVGTRSARLLRFDLTQVSDRPATEWEGLPDEILKLSLSPDGALLYALGLKQIACWDTNTGKRLALQDSQGTIGFLADPHSATVLTSKVDFSLQRLDPMTLKPRETGLPSESRPAWSRGVWLPGHRAIFGLSTEQKLAIWDPSFEVPLQDEVVDPRLRSLAQVEGIDFVVAHPELPVVATISHRLSNKAIKVWEGWSGRLIAELPLPAGESTAIDAAWIGKDRDILIAASGKSLLRWQLHRPRFETVTQVAGDHLFGLSAVADGSILVIGPDRHRHTIQVSHFPATGTDPVRLELPHGSHWPFRQFRPHAEVLSLAPNQLLARGDHSVSVVYKLTGDRGEQQQILNEALCYRLSADGLHLWHLGSPKYPDQPAVTVLDAKTFESKGVWNNALAARLVGRNSVHELAVGTHRAAAGGNSGELYLLDESARLLGIALPVRRDDSVQAMAVTPDDRLVIAGFQSGDVQLVSLAGPEYKQVTIEPKHVGGVTAVAISPDGQWLASGGRDYTVQLWRRVRSLHEEGFAPLFRIDGLPNELKSLRFDHRGENLLVLLRGEHSVRRWNLEAMRAFFQGLELEW